MFNVLLALLNLIMTVSFLHNEASGKSEISSDTIRTEVLMSAPRKLHVEMLGSLNPPEGLS